MIEDALIIHISEAGVVKDISSVLAKDRQGLEVVVEHEHGALAVIKPHRRDAINAHRGPFEPPAWD